MRKCFALRDKVGLGIIITVVIKTYLCPQSV